MNEIKVYNVFIYPLALVLLITMFIGKYIKKSYSPYVIGILVMYFCYIVTYYSYLKER